MNNNQIPDVRLIAQLLGVICIFEEKIENSKQELAGYPEFDARTAFYSIDLHQKGHIDSNDLRTMLNKMDANFQRLATLPAHRLNCFFKKYGTHNRMSYEQFLLLILPKNNPSLAQSMMVRNSNSNRLPLYLQERFQYLISFYIVMLHETQQIKQVLQQQYILNIREIYQRLNRSINSEAGIHMFIQNNQYEINKTSAKYLMNHTSSKRALKDFNENQYRQIFSPVDSMSPVYVQPIQIPTQRNYSPPKITSAARKTFNDSFYERPKDNYLNNKFNHSSRNGDLFTNRTIQQNQNVQVNLIPIMRNIRPLNSLNQFSRQKANEYSPIPSQHLKNFQSINIPGSDNYYSQNRFQPVNNSMVHPSAFTKPFVGVADVRKQMKEEDNNQIATNTHLIDRFMRVSGNVTPGQNNKARVQFDDDLEQSINNNAFQYY